jgi:uncharacterized repeat protein (TIGR04138 family)
VDETSRKIEEICKKDTRYRPEAYIFVLVALEHTLRKINERRHLTGQELSQGIRACALQQYGLMARTVLENWGCHRTDDFGSLVYNMIEAGIMTKTPQDRLEDFREVYDFGEAFTEGYRLGADHEESQ